MLVPRQQKAHAQVGAQQEKNQTSADATQSVHGKKLHDFLASGKASPDYESD
ncbi:hypothetical protein D9M70_618820 [compost metagenome]